MAGGVDSPPHLGPDRRSDADLLDLPGRVPRMGSQNRVTWWSRIARPATSRSALRLQLPKTDAAFGLVQGNEIDLGVATVQ